MASTPRSEQFDIAIIGMAARFPGARSLDEFWNNLLRGVEAISVFSTNDLLQRGVPANYLDDANFVRAGSQISGSDLFDASFFGYSPREAEVIDPQQRLFLECSWEAMENAGYAPRSDNGQVGVFAGASLSAYLLFNVLTNARVRDQQQEFQMMMANDKDFLSTRVSYKLNLTGPSFTVQSGCSTSLVALHLAVQHLLTCQCDMAIAGGVSIGVPQRTGYLYQPGGVVSPDGHCRPFDIEAGGTLFGEGVGVVVLKRLEDAKRDRDTIRAVILGSAVNNDGLSKIGYTAPSVKGQTEVVARALAIAGITADTLGYVEAHGTATNLGDPIEIAALSEAFRQTTDRCGFCGIGSVKSNIGHLDAAAGVAGLIKTTLMLQQKRLVPSLHFHRPNPRIDFEKSPFVVVSEAKQWRSDGVRRAGVSSFGIGGTNAHVILEEAPTLCTKLSQKPLQIISLSAQTPTALDCAISELATHLEKETDPSISNVAFTLQVGREAFKYRYSAVCESRYEAINLLRSTKSNMRYVPGSMRSKIAFLFPGGGTQYPGMGEELYETEAEFRRTVDMCAGLLEPEIGCDLRSILYPRNKTDLIEGQLARPSTALPAIFVTEYALARLLISWRIRPDCMLGHSLGEYTAAALAGVFPLESALSLVAFRGRLLERLPCGAMLNVYRSEEQVRGLIGENISIAAVNAPDQCVISGPVSEIEDAVHILSLAGIEHCKLRIDAAAHSGMIEPLLGDFERVISRVKLGVQSIPFISNRTGTWILESQARDPEYWVKHLRDTVRFADGLRKLMEERNLLVLEVGPSRTLVSLGRQQYCERADDYYPCMRHPQDSMTGLRVLYSTLSNLWRRGVEIDWKAFYASVKCLRVPLPSYPFERQRYWVDPDPIRTNTRSYAPNLDGFVGVYTPSWEINPIEGRHALESTTTPLWLLLSDDLGIGTALRGLLSSQGERVYVAKIGSSFRREEDGTFVVPSASQSDYCSLFRELSLSECSKLIIVNLWTFIGTKDVQEGKSDVYTVTRSMSSLADMARGLASIHPLPRTQFIVVSSETADIEGAKPVDPARGAPLTMLKVMSQEIENVSTHAVDIDLPTSSEQCVRIAAQILTESQHDGFEDLAAYRGLRRWTPTYRRVLLPKRAPTVAAVRKNGVYLLTGGLGNLGLLIARSFAEISPCRLILTGRTTVPPKSKWSQWLESHDPQDKTARTIRMLQEIESKGSSVLPLTADVSDLDRMRFVFEEIDSRFGCLHGVVHLAAVTGEKAVTLVSEAGVDEIQRQLIPKVQGCQVLSRLLKERDIDFCVLFSSTASLLGGPGLAVYGAANRFLDLFADARQLCSGQRWVSVNWDGWLRSSESTFISDRESLQRFALTEEEALLMLHTILASDLSGPQVVSKGDICERVREGSQLNASIGAEPHYNPCRAHQRPTLAVDYVAPGTAIEREVCAVWSDVLGIEKIGTLDNFFELGGTSLIWLRIVAKLKRHLGFDIPITTIFETPTVLSLSQTFAAHSRVDCNPSFRRGELRREKRIRKSITSHQA